MKNLPVTVTWPPVLSRMPVSGQLYAISGSTWIPVPDGTTRADLPKYMTWNAPTVDATQMQRWTVTGSKGATYRVQEFGGAWRCSCPGYQFRRRCRHIEGVKNESR
jgi:hypothetical protein